MALISLEDVTKIYPRGSRPALDDITLDIDRGEFVFLVGASGSGKTTLLSLLLREEEATDGEIRVAGNDLRRISDRQVPQYRRTIGFVFQDYKLLNNKTVWQNVAFALEVIGTRRSAIKSMVPKVLETVGLTGKEDSYPHELSGGEQQRVAIARAYVNHPQILLADEPTGNLDPTTSLGIMEVLDAINRTGTTIVMATHNEEIVNSMRKRVVELHTGRIVRDEEHGSYDSSTYFPDAEVTSKAHQAIGGDARFRPDSVDATERMDAHAALEAGSLAAGLMDGDQGIARLAQSVHSGRTGRYGEAFAPVETTLTWGKGLSLEEVEKARHPQDGDQAGESVEAEAAKPVEVEPVQSGNEPAQSGNDSAQSETKLVRSEVEPVQSGNEPAQGSAEEEAENTAAKPENGLLAPPAPPSAGIVRGRGAQDARMSAQVGGATAQVGQPIAQDAPEPTPGTDDMNAAVQQGNENGGENEEDNR